MSGYSYTILDGCSHSIRRRHGRLRRESGFTLVELLVAMTLMLVVLGGVLGFLDTHRQLTGKDVEVGLVVSDAQAGYERMVREVRQAVCINAPAGTVNCPGSLPESPKSNPIPCSSSAVVGSCLSFKMRAPSSDDHHRLDIRYDCSAGSACVRTINNNGVQRSSNVIPLRPGGAPLTNGGAQAATCSGTPVFMYYVLSSDAWTCTTTPTTATRIDLAARVASSGELPTGAGHTRSVLFQSSVQLRNIG